MGNAKFIGRVGALAVALGIGTAVATTPWVAFADPSDSDSSSESSSLSESSSSESNPASSVDTSANTPADPADEGPEASTAEDTSEARSETPEPSDEDPAEADPATDPESSTTDQSAVSETLPDDESVAVTQSADSDGPPAQSVTVDAPYTALAAAVTTSQDDDLSPVAATMEPQTQIEPPAHEPAASRTVQTTVLEAQAVPALVAAPSAPVTGLVSTLLGWVGFGPTLNAPAAPLQSPGLSGLLSWIGHEIRRTFFNQTPTTAYDPVGNSQAVDGVVTGDLNAVDADGDPLSYTVTKAPQNGTVVINPDGTFAYTPSAQLAITGGTDVFTVKVEDQGFHLHGLSGMLNLVTFGLLGNSGHRSTATVTLIVQPINQPPQVGNPEFTIDNVDPGTGVVTGTVNVTDPDGDSLAYSLSGVPTGDSVAVDPTGEWTYIPSLDARLRATDVNAGPADQQVSFAITASDGLVDTTVTVTAPVTPLAITTIAVGDFPLDVAVRPDGTRVYVTNRDSDTVSVINTGTDTVTTVTVGNAPSHVAVSPDGATAYVTNGGSNTVSVIDTATNTVTTTVVGSAPRGVAVNPNGTRVYVANIGGDSVSVINTTTDAVTTTIPVADGPNWVAVSPDGTRVYVRHANGDSVSVINAATNTVVATIAVGVDTTDVAVSLDGATVYVANPFDNTVSVIDTATNTVATTIPVGAFPYGVAVSPDGDTIYVTNVNGDSVSVIDTATNTVTATLAVGDNPNGVAVSLDGTRIYVTSANGDTVSVLTLG